MHIFLIFSLLQPHSSSYCVDIANDNKYYSVKNESAIKKKTIALQTFVFQNNITEHPEFALGYNSITHYLATS